MAKFYGEVGYAVPMQTVPGVWEDQIVKLNYRGDVVLNQQRWQPSGEVNDNLNLDNSISIVADELAYANFGYIKYVVWNGCKWEVKSLSVTRPRIILRIGGIYNGG